MRGAAEIPDAVRERVRRAAGDRCGYCLSPQRYVMGVLEVEHTIPRARGGSDEEANLWLACGLCNRYKGAQTTAVDPLSGASVALFNPRTQAWPEHFRWSQDGAMVAGLTDVGRATVGALRLNNELAVEVRRHWALAGWHPPNESA
jgi:hypothetical protein